MSAASDRPRRRPDNAHRAIGDEGGLVVVPAESKVQVLNPVGSRIYSMLDGKHSRSEIVEAVVAEFEVTPEVAERDLDAFLAQLETNGMLASPEGDALATGTR